MVEQQVEFLKEKYLDLELAAAQTGEHISVKDYLNSEYYINLSIGTPAQKFEVVPDTGSANMWVYSSGCWSMACINKPNYKSKKSSTYQKDGELIQLNLNGKKLKGHISQDIVQVGDVKATMKFAEMTSVDKGIFLDSAKATGVIGFSYDTIAVDNLKTFMDDAQLTQKTFSFILKNEGEDSYLMVPGYDTNEFVISSTHKVLSKDMWTVDADYLQQGAGEWIRTPENIEAAVDSSISFISAP